MATISAWAPATAYAKGSTVRQVAAQTAQPVALVNGNFEGGDTDWTKGAGWAISSGDAYAGTYKAIFTGAGSGTISASGTYAATPGQVISATVKAKVLDAADGATAFLKWYDASNALISTSSGLESSVESGSWMQLAVSATAPPETAFVVFGVEATRTVGASVAIDDARWDYTAPLSAIRMGYRAVQDALGVSGAVEPTWPTVVGSRVNDGTVIWEAVQLAYIEWTATPIIQSGATEPAWPTTVGAFISDGTANWECVSRRVEDENCPQSKVVAILASKVFAADGDIIRFSATANPLDWSSDNDAGFLPAGLQQANADDMAVLYPYRGNLACWNAHCFQMWQVDPDPSQMALLDQMDGVGSTHPLAARAVGNELYYLANAGIRSVGIAQAAQNMQAGDVGMPIDVLVQAAMVQAAIDGQKAISTYWPGMGQYWLCFGDDGATAGAGGALELLCPGSFGGAVGDAYSYTYVASGGTAPYTYQIASGSLPPGLSLNASTGEVSGTFTSAGSYSYGVKVVDALGVEAFCGWAADVVEDDAEVIMYELLVTGSAATPGGPLMASANAVEVPEFVGIEQATGATIEGGVPAQYGGTWVVNDLDSATAIYSTSIRTAWSSMPTDRACSGDITAGPAGFALIGGGPIDAFDDIGVAAPASAGFESYQFATTYPGATPYRAFGQGNEAAMARYAGGYYWFDTAARGELVKTDSLSASTHELVFKRLAGTEFIFLDIESFAGDLYAAIYNADNNNAQIRKSTDGGATWPTLVVDIDVFAGDAPIFLQSGGGVLLALARNCATVWTSEDGFAVAHSTGIATHGNGLTPAESRRDRGRMIAFAGGRFFIVSGTNTATPALANKCVSTVDGLTFSAAVDTGLSGVAGIATNYLEPGA